MDKIKPALKGQYHAALDMLKGAITECPGDIWLGGVPPRSFWRLAYHTLFYTHLYLQVKDTDFVLWEYHRDEVLSLDRERLDAPVPRRRGGSHGAHPRRPGRIARISFDVIDPLSRWGVGLLRC